MVHGREEVDVQPVRMHDRLPLSKRWQKHQKTVPAAACQWSDASGVNVDVIWCAEEGSGPLYVKLSRLQQTSNSAGSSSAEQEK